MDSGGRLTGSEIILLLSLVHMMKWICNVDMYIRPISKYFTKHRKPKSKLDPTSQLVCGGSGHKFSLIHWADDDDVDMWWNDDDDNDDSYHALQFTYTYLLINERTTSDPELHAHLQQEQLVDMKNGQRCDHRQSQSARIEVRLADWWWRFWLRCGGCRHLVKVPDQFPQQKRLGDSENGRKSAALVSELRWFRMNR